MYVQWIASVGRDRCSGDGFAAFKGNRGRDKESEKSEGLAGWGCPLNAPACPQAKHTKIQRRRLANPPLCFSLAGAYTCSLRCCYQPLVWPRGKKEERKGRET